MLIMQEVTWSIIGAEFAYACVAKFVSTKALANEKLKMKQIFLLLSRSDPGHCECCIRR